MDWYCVVIENNKGKMETSFCEAESPFQAEEKIKEYFRNLVDCDYVVAVDQIYKRVWCRE